MRLFLCWMRQTYMVQSCIFEDTLFSLKLDLLCVMQVNGTDVHAGELYVLAGDPGEDNNVYKLISENIMTKMANVTDVSWL